MVIVIEAPAEVDNCPRGHGRLFLDIADNEKFCLCCGYRKYLGSGHLYSYAVAKRVLPTKYDREQR